MTAEFITTTANGRQFPVEKLRGKRWVIVEAAPCPFCPTWTGPHGHSVLWNVLSETRATLDELGRLGEPRTLSEPPITWKAAWRMWAASRSDPAKMEHHDTLRTRLETIRQVFASIGIGDEFPLCERGCELTAGHDGPCPAWSVETALD